MTSPTRSTLLEAKQLSFGYGRKTVLSDFSVNVFPGELVGLLGPNGAGKTTIIRLLAGLLPCQHGEIFLNHQRVTTQSIEKRVHAGLGYLPQEPSLFTTLSVLDNLVLSLEENGWKTKAIRPWVETILHRFEMAHLSHQLVSTLSGGERRRVEVLRALALKPKILLLDEPFTAIDPITVSKLQKLFQSLVTEGLGILITDHNVRETLKICHRAMIIDNGALLCQGQAEEIARHPLALDRYLGADFHLDGET